MFNVTYLIPLAGLLALIFTYRRSMWVARQDVGTERMAQIADHIAEGAMAFLKAEYRVLAFFVIGVAVLLGFLGATTENSSPIIALSFVVGAACSGLAGLIGMKVATKANVRTAQAARESLGKALEVAFTGGSVMGLAVVGLGVLGLSSLFFFYSWMYGTEEIASVDKVITVITGFSFGASSIALFARVGGGIYTKAADVGADLVGKVEAGIPEDHSLNPATIADNVGDNVGDVAGMGADLFESFVGSIIAAMVLGAVFTGPNATGFIEHSAIPLAGVMLPMFLAAAGIVISIGGSLLVRVRDGGDPQAALNMGGFAAAGALIVAFWFIIHWMLPDAWTYADPLSTFHGQYTANGVFFASIIGLVSGVLIGVFTEYYTGCNKRPVLDIVRQSLTGSATNIIAGLQTGMISVGMPVLIIVAAILGSFHFAGMYGIAIAAVGMLANTGIQLAVDAYGPISDNAGGIAQMTDLPPEVRRRTDRLDAVGNTTAAIGKGFAIGSAALTSLAFFAAYMTAADISTIDVSKANVMAGLFIGGALTYIFSALSIGAVGRAAMAMIHEVRRQFSEIPPLKAALEMMRKNDGVDEADWPEADLKVLRAADGVAEYGKCVEISTKSAIREMVLPGLLAVAAPVVVGFTPIFGKEALGGMLAGVTLSGVLMAIFQANAGGAWDNAKKMFEAGVEIDGKMYHKGSDPHKAAVVGDTVGDPLKDTSGPSLNILLKLISIVSLVIASSL